MGTANDTHDVSAPDEESSAGLVSTISAIKQTNRKV